MGINRRNFWDEGLIYCPEPYLTFLSDWNQPQIMCCNGKKSRITLALRFLFIFLASFPVILYLLWVTSCHLIVWDTSWAKGVKEFMMKLTNKQSIKSCLKATENPTREVKIVGAHMNIFDYSCSIKTPESIVTSRQQWTATIVSAVLENNQRDFQHLLIRGMFGAQRHVQEPIGWSKCLTGKRSAAKCRNSLKQTLIRNVTNVWLSQKQHVAGERCDGSFMGRKCYLDSRGCD